MKQLVSGCFVIGFVLMFLGVAIGAGVWVWIGSGGEPSMLLVVLLFFLTTVLMFYWSLATGAEFLRQLHGLEDAQGASGYLVGALSGFPAEFASYRHGALAEESKNSTVVTIGGPGFVDLSNDTAVVIERMGQFERVAGCALIELEPFETVRGAVDLRPQTRTSTTRALTRDGIPVKADFEVEFRIAPQCAYERENGPVEAAPAQRRGPRTRLREAWRAARNSSLLRPFFGRARVQRLPSQPFTYCEENVARAVYLNRVTKTGPSAWQDSPAFLTGSRLEDVLAAYHFDKLFEADATTPSPAPRQAIQEQVMRELTPILAGRGIELIRFHLGTIEIDPGDPPNPHLKDTIVRQRIRAWQSEWVSRDTEKMGRSRGEVMRIEEQMRAEVQRDMIIAIADGLQSSPYGAHPPDQVVAWRFLQAIEQIVNDPSRVQYLTVEGMLSDEMLKKFGVLRSSLEDDGGPALPGEQP